MKHLLLLGVLVLAACVQIDKTYTVNCPGGSVATTLPDALDDAPQLGAGDDGVNIHCGVQANSGTGVSGEIVTELGLAQ